ncbi:MULTISPECIES: hypothetical protein [Arthrobacter]|uniref:hypothetical protein n=1 Tax=Arthrobacter TaxID=1663 RepID=UPI001F3A82BC|nr:MULTISPECIES: hypothetical protein [Arthrobacter]
MSAYEFQSDRSEVLRRQLVEMAAPARIPARQRAAMHQAGFVHATPRMPPDSSWTRRAVVTLRKLPAKIKAVFLGLVLVGAAGGAAALVLTPPDNSLDASRIIESLSRPQQQTDKLPAPALAILPKDLIDPSQTRLLGKSNDYTYYGAPAGDKICIVPVDSAGQGRSMGCTLLKSFEAYGLKTESPDRTEAGWLVVPAGAKKALESVKSEGGWSQQAPNFLVRTNH